jgi:uncharacterized protein YecT (DUF1311 family)
MKFLIVTLFLVASSILCLAQMSKEYRACGDQAKTQLEMNACASEELARTDANMDRVYRLLLSRTKNQQVLVGKVEALQKVWIAYRDSYMDAMYPAENKQAEYGTIFPMEADLLRAKLTQQHIANLRELLQQNSGPN